MRWRQTLLGKPGSEVAKPKKKPLHSQPRGCDSCSLNKVRGINKVIRLEQIRGRKAMLWAQSPGRQENSRRKELVGPTGELLWKTIKEETSLSRLDFDIQNVVRCWPAQRDYSGMLSSRDPTKGEIHCCSIYNEQALDRNQGNAVVHLVLGEKAGLSLLGKEYKKDRPVFWKESWNAYVVLAAHPAYFLRQGGETSWKFELFRTKIRSLPYFLHYPGRFGFVLGQRYPILQENDLEGFDAEIQREAKAGRTVTFDLEFWKVEGRLRALTMGIAYGRFDASGQWVGKAVSIPIDHPEATRSSLVRKWVRELLQDDSIGKTAHHAPADVFASAEALSIPAKKIRAVRDTELTMYFRFPDHKRFGLEALGMEFFPQFADYKQMAVPYMTEDKGLHKMPLKSLCAYNAADADLSQRLSAKYHEKRDENLLRVYIPAAMVLDRMQLTGPKLDYSLHEEVGKSLPKRIAKLKSRLQVLARDPNFNPGSAPQVTTILYKRLKVKPLKHKGQEIFGTGAEILNSILTRDGENEFISGVLEYRGLTKMKNTYLDNYKASADAHNGELRTRWNLTGTGTGRMSSGGKKDAKSKKLINMQNLHGDPMLENMLVSDTQWQKAL